MTHLTFAAVLLSAALAAAPEKARAGAEAAPSRAAGAKPGSAAGGPAAKAGKPVQTKASKQALQDARAALLGPCAPEMATTRLKTVAVIGGDAMNELAKREKLPVAPAVHDALFLAIEYDTDGGTEKDYRQVNSLYHLTTQQAQVLVGEKLCVFGKAP